MKEETGALLLSFIIIFTLAAILSSSMAYLSQNETYSILPANSIEQSYYLSESGLRFGRMKRDSNKTEYLKTNYEDIPIQIPTVAYSSPDKKDFAGFFSLKFENGKSYQVSNTINIYSIGSVNTQKFIETCRQTNAQYTIKGFSDKDRQLILIDDNGTSFLQTSIDRKWNLDKTFYSDYIDNKGLVIKSNSDKNWNLASLYWSKNDLLPRFNLWQNLTTKTLSYRFQMRFNIYPLTQRKKDFMVGLSFRIGFDRENFYGISFFKSSGRLINNPPCWLDKDSKNCDGLLGESFRFTGEDELCDLPNSKCLETNIPYLVFWEKNGNKPFELIAFSDLTRLKDKSRIVENLTPLEWGIKEWITLGIHINEEASAGQKLNDIQVYLRKSIEKNKFDIETDFSWTNPELWEQVRFEKIGTTGYIDKKHIRDFRLPSTDFSEPIPSMKEIPDEVGFHALYDNRLDTARKYNIYFYGFDVLCEGSACPDEDSNQTFVQF